MDDLDIDDEDCSSVNDLSSDCWASRYTPWEEDCIHSVDNGDDIDLHIEREKDLCSQKLWHSFQNAACCVAQLYKDRENGVSLWIPFQNSASSITSLYKDCTESQKRFAELGFQSGVQRRNKEIIAWLKKRKRIIRREELLAFLCGNHHHIYPYLHHRNPSWNTPRQRVTTIPAESGSSSSISSGIRTPPNHNVTHTRLTLSESGESASPDGEGDLQTFREALALSGIRNSPQHGSNGSCNSSRRSSVNRSGACSANSHTSLAELNAFITEEFTRHAESKKRSASSTDVVMDSPTHKRSKL
ncbi:hypothetical protein B4U79_05416 [Dinothrombium tinctorium]|uniref:Uncharacterized protein n=1 Tax=Dinothrombium tinctorium TaxID=1965070 RepID=A0A3S3PMF0_9ACAR|nr:hypothetical protein B4U79_05416 [Dinothrombium tinctorium]